jgi:organic radical activating enzyme
MTKYFCPIPFVNIEARTNGDISPCCQYDGAMLHNSGEKFNLNKDTLTNAWVSDWLENLRKDFLQGEKPIPCNRCWVEEDAGIKSRRLRALDDFQEILDKLLKDEILDKPLSMDLKLGNICNNKCRICSSYASSQWIAEEKFRDGNNAGIWNQMREFGRWPESNISFWEDFKEISSDVELLDFYGGEPFLIKEHYDVLENLIKDGRSQDIVLHYNTNGTIFPERGLELWSKFKKVIISFSIDGIGPHFEYLRHPAKWDSVVENIKKILNKNISTIYIDICYTVSIYNIYYLDEIFFWRNLELPNTIIYLNYLSTPTYLSCKILPTEIKNNIKEKFIKKNNPNLNEAVKYLMDGEYDSDKLEIFYNITAFSDSYRNEKFSNTFPEFYQLLKQYTNCPENF